MKARFLFPHKLRPVGYGLLVLALIIMGLNLYTDGGLFNSTSLNNLNPIPLSVWIEIIKNDFTYVAIIVGLVIIGFSKEPVEDEQIVQLRLESLQWAIYINYAIFILCVLFVYGMNFLSVIIYNTITPLIIFIISFRWKIYSINRDLKNSLS